MQSESLFIPAAERNARPILGVIEHELQGCATVLEIGSGTAQQAEVFVAAMPWLTWQTSDLAEFHAAIQERLSAIASPRLLPPLLLDVLGADAGELRYGAVYSSNTAHIMSQAAVQKMFEYVGAVLEAGGVFVLYGPFRLNGEFTTDSNAAFDASLRRQDPSMGLRDLEALDQFARAAGLQRKRLFAMPSNNLLAIWAKEERGR